MTPSDARPGSRRARREGEGAAGAGTVEPGAGLGSGRIALGWVDDDAVARRQAAAEFGVSTHVTVAPDLLARRPRRSPLRPGVIVPFLGAAGLAGAYAAATLLWPLYAVEPVITPAAIAAVASPATVVTWPGEGGAAVGVAGFDSAPASTADRMPMASITKIVTALMILEQQPLALGQSGPEFAFTDRDRDTYYDYLSDDESALDVPVDGTLSQYQMLQGILIGSAGNYTDRLASSIWPTDAVFAQAAAQWLARNNLPGITVAEPTGIDETNAADPASLIALARIALSNPVVAEIVRTPAVELPGAGLVENTNDLLADPTVVGIKTGSLAGIYNLLAAQDVAVGETTVRVFAAALGQPSDEERDGQTARLMAEVAAEASVPRTLPAASLVGVVTPLWGDPVNLATDADASVLLWNGATAPVTADLSLGDARTTGASAGTVTVTGPLGAATADVHLTADIPDPDPWWRLTHPLQLWGLAD